MLRKHWPLNNPDYTKNFFSYLNLFFSEKLKNTTLTVVAGSSTSLWTLGFYRDDILYVSKICIKRSGSTEIWARIFGFEVQGANQYTMGPGVLA